MLERLPNDVKDLGQWRETEVVRSATSRVLNRQLLWGSFVVSARTGERLPVNYYQSVTIHEDEASAEAWAVKEDQALMSLVRRVREASEGVAYLPAYDRVGMIFAAVDALLSEDAPPGRVGETSDQAVWEAISSANEEYERRWAAAQALDAERGDGFGWRIPIVPLTAEVTA